MNIHKPDLKDFASFSAQMGEWIASGDLHYFEPDWERFGEWLEWFETRETEPSPGWCDLIHRGFPPRNIVLLGRASTQEEVDSLGGRVSSDPFRQWRTAAMLTPVEELGISAICDVFFKGKLLAQGVEQIIVQPPKCNECSGTGMTLIESADSEGYYSGSCGYCDNGLLWHHVHSIIRQVWGVRGECEDCGGCGEVRLSYDLSHKPPRVCSTCHGTGLAPGLPRLLIEGDERYQERMEL